MKLKRDSVLSAAGTMLAVFAALVLYFSPKLSYVPETVVLTREEFLGQLDMILTDGSSSAIEPDFLALLHDSPWTLEGAFEYSLYSCEIPSGELAGYFPDAADVPKIEVLVDGSGSAERITVSFLNKYGMRTAAGFRETLIDLYTYNDIDAKLYSYNAETDSFTVEFLPPHYNKRSFAHAPQYRTDNSIRRQPV
ncbi:MAG: hypothetical protein ACOX81_01105 [Candidatus Heteroscillospira sp.]